MKKKISEWVTQALHSIPEFSGCEAVHVTRCKELKDRQHGEYSTNCALVLAKKASLSPRELAERLLSSLAPVEFIQKIVIAGPGFINFYLTEVAQHAFIIQANREGPSFGCAAKKNKRVHIEYVSANPTGPLHVGHGRGAAFGASVANLLTACGYSVHREYYVNDRGRQMHVLALSVWLRYLQLQKKQKEKEKEKEKSALIWPENIYQGAYVIDIAQQLVQQYQDRFYYADVFSSSVCAHSETSDLEGYLDQYIHWAQTVLGMDDFSIIFHFALEKILDDIRDDLQEFKVDYDQWFHESTLFEKNFVEEGLLLLERHGHVFEKDGAKWFRSTAFGDEKDRVLVRANGVTTYFASDVAYHLYKYRQGYDTIIDIFGADHHGYIARIQGFLEGLGEDPNKVRILMVQFAILYRGREKISMSTRGGQFVTLRALRHEVGNDAARFFYVMRKPEQHLDFDLELAKAHSNDNPVYYIQYAHARICSVWRQMAALQAEQGGDESRESCQETGRMYLSLLTTVHEKNLIAALMYYPDIIEESGLNHEPHVLAYFLLELAGIFHTYYNAEKFLVESSALRQARLCLVAAIEQVFANGLALLGIKAPTQM